jgi:glycosyltransferase involved in cell wall biosynthesis
MILLRAGWVVNYFGIQSEGSSSKLVFREALADCVTLWQHQPPGLKQKLQFAAFTLAALWRALWQRPAWVYCSDLMSCPAAWLIGHFTRCKVLYHEHDSPSEPNGENRKQKVERGKTETLKTEKLKAENKTEMSAFQNVSVSEFKEVSTFQLFLLWTRKRVGREADLVVLPNEKRLELFVQATGRQGKSFCVHNCPRKEEVGKTKAEMLKPETLKAENGIDGRLRLAFHGSINRDRLPLAVVEAMSRFPGRVHLSVVGYETVGAKGYMAGFMQAAERSGLGKAVEFVGALPKRHDIYQQASKCDVGLAFMPLQDGDVNMANMTGASNKPFDYLACGLALLVCARPDWERMFVQPGYGLACDPDDTDSIAAQLRWFLMHPVEIREMGERGRQQILKEWNYESQFTPVLRILQTNYAQTNI